MKRLIWSMILMIYAANSFAAFTRGDEKKFQQGTKLLLNGDTRGALLLYEQLRAEGIESPELYGNMANAYYKDKNYGKAIAWYDKALLLAPRDTQLMHNKTLTLAKLKTTPADNYPISPIQLDDLLGVAMVLLIISSLLFFINATGILHRWDKELKKGGIGLLICAASALIVLSGWLLYNQNRAYVVVTAGTGVARMGPSALANQIAVLNEGEQIETYNYYKGWYKIRLANGYIGWVSGGDVECVGK